MEGTVHTFKVLFQILLHSGWNKAPVTAASIKMQEKLNRIEPLNFGTRQDAKKFISLPVQTWHGIFHPPSKTKLPSGAKHKPTTPSCPVPPVRAQGCLEQSGCTMAQSPSCLWEVQSRELLCSRPAGKDPLGFHRFYFKSQEQNQALLLGSMRAGHPRPHGPKCSGLRLEKV